MKRLMAIMTMILLAGCAAESTVSRNNYADRSRTTNVVNTASGTNAAVPDSSAPRGRFSLASQSTTTPAPPVP